MSDNKLVEGFEGNEQEEKEEIRRYGLKQKQKAKNRINLIILFTLGGILLVGFIYILSLYNDLSQRNFQIQILTQENKKFFNDINENKDKIDKMSEQNNRLEKKMLSLFNYCVNQPTSIKEEINELKEEIENNKKINQEKLNDLIEKNNNLRNILKYTDNYYNIC